MFVHSTARVTAPEAAIAANNADFSAALARADAAGMAACYTTDARLLPAGHPAIRGREAIGAFWAAGIAAGLRAVTLETLDISVCGDIAVESGRATVEMRPPAGPESVDAGKYVVVHEHRDGAWRWALDIFNSDGDADA